MQAGKLTYTLFLTWTDHMILVGFRMELHQGSHQVD